jgi:site-specific recombinase XerD
MLTTYFTRPTTRAQYYASPAGPYLDAFTEWLAQRGYRQESIRRCVQGAAQFVTWIQTAEGSLASASPATLALFRHHLSQCQQLCRPIGQHSVRWLGAVRFVTFLQTHSLSAPPTVPSAPELPAVLSAFEQWMRTQRGVQPQTLQNYRRHLLALLTELGDEPEQFDAARLRLFLLASPQPRSAAWVKTRANALRMFLRYLSAHGRCRPGLEAALPRVAQWRLATLPRYLPPEDVERVLRTCEGSTARRIRDKAIVLLLARLGLRAGEVATLRLQDIEWSEGTFRVIGKSRREAKLPLPQEVGDALLRYIRAVRPAVPSEYLFCTLIAPWRPITRYVVKAVAAQAIRRAGVRAPSFGSHVLRHSAATGLLRQGASLQVIGEVLRHRSVDTTAHYAKVDVGLLQEVVRPWPGGTSC